MITVEGIAPLTAQIRQWKQQGRTIALVPTMGYLHAGHLALFEAASKECDRTVVSIFVNPRQFGPTEDLEKYPRDLERDTSMAKNAGVDLLFVPSIAEMYPEGYQTTVSVSQISQGLCGKSRPGHFDGVATVVAKLFNLVEPDKAIFGEKDYQQLAVLRRMVRDLNFPVAIVGHAIVREEDGLAMSSRNKYLDATERKDAVCLHDALQHGQRRVAEHRNLLAQTLIDELRDIIERQDGFMVDYVAIVDAHSLLPKDTAQPGDLVALAVHVHGKVRLIDNIIL